MTINNIDVESKKWDKYWTANKDIIKYDKVNNVLIYLWFESGKFLSNYLNKNQKGKFIELGCGGGEFLQYFIKKYRNLEIFGIDFSSIGCKTALKRLDGNIPASNIICADILKINSQPSYDISFSFGLIEHFKNPNIPLKKHVDILKKDGIMLCIIPNIVRLNRKILKSKIWFSNEKLKKKSNDSIFGIREISINSLEKWCKSFGLRKTKILPIGGFFPLSLIETITFKKKSKGKKIQFLHRYGLLPFLIVFNVLTLFRINSFNFSPFIIATGRKK